MLSCWKSWSSKLGLRKKQVYCKCKQCYWKGQFASYGLKSWKLKRAEHYYESMKKAKNDQKLYCKESKLYFAKIDIDIIELNWVEVVQDQYE